MVSVQYLIYCIIYIDRNGIQNGVSLIWYSIGAAKVHKVA